MHVFESSQRFFEIPKMILTESDLTKRFKFRRLFITFQQQKVLDRGFVVGAFIGVVSHHSQNLYQAVTGNDESVFFRVLDPKVGDHIDRFSEAASIEQTIYLFEKPGVSKLFLQMVLCNEILYCVSNAIADGCHYKKREYRESLNFEVALIYFV